MRRGCGQAPRRRLKSLTGSVSWRWFPQVRGDDYETTQQLRAGKIFGQAPFDELFILGLERDNDLPMRAHIGTRDGRKGSAPLGREYFLHNWELDKNYLWKRHRGAEAGAIFRYWTDRRSRDSNSAPTSGSSTPAPRQG